MYLKTIRGYEGKIPYAYPKAQVDQMLSDLAEVTRVAEDRATPSHSALYINRDGDDGELIKVAQEIRTNMQSFPDTGGIMREI
ncbi:hypothetical protein FRB96_002577 [Tulasnella sp. 330]|nr:hypothetical protein FRB96_002577 [Tulasnella sp. 330]